MGTAEIRCGVKAVVNHKMQTISADDTLKIMRDAPDGCIARKRLREEGLGCMLFGWHLGCRMTGCF